MMSPAIEIEVLENGYVVRVANPPKKGKEDEYVPYEERYSKYAAKDLDAVVGTIKQHLPSAGAGKKSQKQEFDTAFKDAKREE